MEMPGRDTVFKNGYRYGFNGKEIDNEPYGQGDEYDYGMRIYNPRIGRFLSVDPLSNSYPWYTPYQFAGNKPIWAVDKDGLEEATSTSKGLTFFPFIVPIKAKTPAAIMQQQFVKSADAFSQSRTGRFINGGINVTAGIAGSIASVAYIGASDGTGAALGGVISFQFSVGQASIGISQMMNALFGPPGVQKVLDNSSSVPGLISYALGFKYAAFVDAVGALVPSITSSGEQEKFLNLKGYTQNVFGVVDLAEKFANTQSIKDAIVLLDQARDVKNFVLETFNLASEQTKNGQGLIQKLQYSGTYTVQSGETLSDIAKKLNTTTDVLASQNDIQDSNHIEAGQKIKYTNTVYGKR